MIRVDTINGSIPAAGVSLNWRGDGVNKGVSGASIKLSTRADDSRQPRSVAVATLTRQQTFVSPCIKN